MTPHSMAAAADGGSIGAGTTERAKEESLMEAARRRRQTSLAVQCAVQSPPKRLLSAAAAARGAVGATKGTICLFFLSFLFLLFSSIGAKRASDPFIISHFDSSSFRSGIARAIRSSLLSVCLTQGLTVFLSLR